MTRPVASTVAPVVESNATAAAGEPTVDPPTFGAPDDCVPDGAEDMDNDGHSPPGAACVG